MTERKAGTSRLVYNRATRTIDTVRTDGAVRCPACNGQGYLAHTFADCKPCDGSGTMSEAQAQANHDNRN